MNHALLSVLLVCSFLVAPPVFAVGEDEPYFIAATAIYTNSKYALLASSLPGIQVFAERAMKAALDLQSEAMAAGDDTLVLFAQGAYNNFKRASMSSSYEEARNYSEQAVSFAHKMRALLGFQIDEKRHANARRNLNDDRQDPGQDIYDVSGGPERPDRIR
jgi:hypothetical protein